MKSLFLLFLLLWTGPTILYGNSYRIGFGSCNHQDKDQRLWKVISKANLDLWIWSGDVIYGNTDNIQTLRSYYQKQANHEAYNAFAKRTPIIGVWDDHDFASNDSDRTAKKKVESQKAFLDFLGEPETSPRRQQEGIYWLSQYGSQDQLINIYLLDTRYHKDPWETKNGTILGSDQWTWLEKQLKQSKAKINIIVSSIQVLAQDHRFEKWDRFPKERQRLLDLIKQSELANPIIISGDRHIAEIAKIKGKSQDIWEITSSGLTHSYKGFTKERNRHRIHKVFADLHFGEMLVDWTKKTITMSIINIQGEKVISQTINLR